MKTTVEWLDAVKVKCDLPSDYALARVLNLTRQQISKYRSGRETMSDYTAVKVAALLAKPPLEVIASANAERAKHDDEKITWQRLAKEAARAAVIAIVLIVPFGSPSPAEASSLQWVASGGFPALCIMLIYIRLRRHLRRRQRRPLAPSPLLIPQAA